MAHVVDVVFLLGVGFNKNVVDAGRSVRDVSKQSGCRKSGYTDFNSAVRSITQYIAWLYNENRSRQFNNGLSPQATKQEYQRTSKVVASFC